MLFQCRPSEIARWPAWELDLLEEYLAREPAPVERVEIALARLIAIYVNGHLPDGYAPKGVADFLPYLSAWSEVMSPEEVEQTLRALA